MSFMNTLRRIAEKTVDHAMRILPPSRREWGQSMRAELDHVASKHLIAWAFGCALTSYTERLKAMNHSSLLVSKWVVGLEALLCFGPLSLLWFAAVARLNLFFGEPWILFDTAIITIAPLSLILAFRFVLFDRHPSRPLMRTLSITSLAIGVIMIIGKYSRPGQAFLWSEVEWSLPVLASFLPALCCWHLSMFAKNGSGRLQPA